MEEVRVISMGLAKVEYGDVAATGAMQSTLTQLGYTYKDSFEMQTDEPSVEEFYVEEVDAPLDMSGELGKTIFEWDILNPKVSEMAALGGGTATASDNKLETADAWTSIEKAFKFTPKKGFIVSVPRASVIAYPKNGFKKGQPMLWHVKATVLQIEVTSGSGTPAKPMILQKLT